MGVALVALAALVILVALWWPRRAPPTEQGPAVAAEFLESLRTGAIDAAWEGTTAEFKSYMGRDRFRRFVRQHPVLREPAELERCEPASMGALTLTECVFQPDSGTAVVRVLLAPDGPHWRVERIYVE